MVNFIIERKRLGTAGALSLLETPLSSPFFVINVDLLTNVDFRTMLRFHETEGNQLKMTVREEGHRVAFGVVRLKGYWVLKKSQFENILLMWAYILLILQLYL